MPRTLCSTCGAAYEGWKCPSCFTTAQAKRAAEAASARVAEGLERNAQAHSEASRRLAERIAEEQEATRQAHYAAAQRVEAANLEASRKHTESIANSWRLESAAKADRAFELYEACMYEDAYAVAQQAFQQDRGNLDAYKIAAWSLGALGDHQAAHSLYVKQINLLVTSDYNTSPLSFATVLAGLPSDEELIASSRRVFARVFSL